jgi:hypothetical protein
MKRAFADKLEGWIMKKLKFKYVDRPPTKKGPGRPCTGAIHKIIQSEVNECRKQIKKSTAGQKLKKIGIRRPPGSVALHGKRKKRKKGCFQEAYVVRYDAVSILPCVFVVSSPAKRPHKQLFFNRREMR